MNMHEKLHDTNLTGTTRTMQAIQAPWFHADETQLRQELQAYRLELEKTQRHLDEEFCLLSRITENATEGILITDACGIIQSVNPAFEKSTGYTASEAIGHTPALLKSGHHDKNFYKALWSTLKEHGHWQGEVWNRNKSGEIYPEWLNISAVKDSQQKVTHYVGIFSDLHTQEYILERLHYLANYDGLTGLPNRRLFLDRLNVSLSHARRDKHMLAVMFVDLDRFKQINDTLGHKIGDELLAAVSERMKNCLREGDTLARQGGDEFTAILPVVAHPDDAINVAKKFLDCCTKPMKVNGHELHVTFSIGIGIYPSDGEDADSLLHHADVAMYRIKESGRNGYLRYSAEMDMCPIPNSAPAENKLISAISANNPAALPSAI